MRGLAGKLLVLLLVAGVLPLLVSGVLAILAARSTTSAAIREGHREIARRAAREITGVIEGARDLLRIAADNRIRAELTPEQQSRMLAGLKLQFRAIASVTRVAPDGTPVAWSDALRPPPVPAGDPGLVAALAGESWAGAAPAGDELVPRLRVALPVHELGRPAGALLATLDLVEMWRIVDDIRLGASGHVLLLDGAGAVIAHGDPRGKALVVRGTRLPVLAAAAHEAAGGALFEATGSLGGRALSVAVPVPSTPWVLVLEQDAGEAFAGVRRLSWLLAAVALIAAVLATEVGLRLVRRRVLAPVLALEHAAGEYRRERFEHRVTIATGDELERLAGAMNAMAASVAAARDELRRTERARALGMLAGGLAHDLQHTLAAFQALLMRESRYAPDELERRLAEAARRETPRLAALVDKLRDVGRAGVRADSDFAAAELGEVVEGFRARAEELGVRLALEPHDPALRLRADRHMLARALANLVANALEASPADGVVTVSMTRRDDDLELVVTDEGPGIDEATGEELFRGFASTKESGLGLGLSVVRQVAEAHHGRVTASRLAPRGSRFALIVPLAQSRSS